MRQLVRPGATKGDSARSRRTVVGSKAKEKPAAASAHRRLCFAAVLAVTFFLWYQFSLLNDDGVRIGQAKGSADPCQGRYIYMHKLPPRFNTDIIREACRDAGGERICASVANSGLGRPLADPADGVLTGENGWYGTRQLALDVIFHNRMKQYECLANHTTVATVIFVPFYASLDFARYAGHDNATRDAATVDIADWLKWRPEWDRRADGRDHFLVAGRTAWDLMRDGGNFGGPDWGTNLLVTPVGRHMSVLVCWK